MKNPCNQCIVQAACNKACYVLAKYLKETLKFPVDDSLSFLVADGVREGRFRLLDNDRDWESTS